MNSPVKKELFRTSQSWDGADLPDYPVGKPELVAMRYVFEPGSSLHLHHHDVMNFGIVEQGELTIVSADGKEKVIHQGEAVVEMVGTVHHGENRGQVPVVLNMFYLSQEGLPLSVSDECTSVTFIFFVQGRTTFPRFSVLLHPNSASVSVAES